MKTLSAMLVATVLLAAPVVVAQDYIGGGTANVDGVGSAGLTICQSPPSDLPLPFGVGGVCDVDCAGSSTDCVVANSNTGDVFEYNWDTDGDGIADTGVGPANGAVSTGGFKGLGSVFVHVGGTTGTISSFDP